MDTPPLAVLPGHPPKQGEQVVDAPSVLPGSAMMAPEAVPVGASNAAWWVTASQVWGREGCEPASTGWFVASALSR